MTPRSRRRPLWRDVLFHAAATFLNVVIVRAQGASVLAFVGVALVLVVTTLRSLTAWEPPPSAPQDDGGAT